MRMMEDLPSLAARFINTTAGHIFLTGKAGTGKTTFLKNLPKLTHKNHIVVAPTGIAALNAGGVTIHSQFLLPPVNFIPERNHSSGFQDNGLFVDQHVLARKHPLNAARKKVLRSIDLLVIDEVSMLRADLLDAIDYRMKAARNNFRESFGGVQVLFIGDLYQLPPVVKNDVWLTLNQYYNSPWFYEALCLKNEPPVYIELNAIFRQTDNAFINILNHLRNNIATPEDIAVLNRQVRSAEEIRGMRDVITLTTHNYKADEINQTELRNLDTERYTFNAIIEGDFPENMYPVLPELVLKTGAQIMFVRNDNSEEKAYFNGKLATVTEISGDDIWVELAESRKPYKLKREKWENKKYKVDEVTQEMDEEVLGSFEQYPVRLAWAITVHKSQGLTFDKAMIDVGQAFADGQVYVALSRLRSLEGLILRTPIHPSVISTDKQVIAFAENNHRPDELVTVMKSRQQEFIGQLAERTFDFSPLIRDFTRAQKEWTEDGEHHSGSVIPAVVESLKSEESNTLKFRQQLHILIRSGQQEQLLDRLSKGCTYYKVTLAGNLRLLLTQMESLQGVRGVKSYMTTLSELDLLLDRKLQEVERITAITKSILAGEERPDLAELEQQHRNERLQWISEIRREVGQQTGSERPRRARRKNKHKHGDSKSTYEITMELLNRGMTVEQIADERKLAKGTIESHLAKEVEAGRLSIYKFMTEESVRTIMDALPQMPEGFSSKDLFGFLGGKFGYNQIRAVIAHSKLKASSVKE